MEREDVVGALFGVLCPSGSAKGLVLAEFDRLTALVYADNGETYKSLAFDLLKERDRLTQEKAQLQIDYGKELQETENLSNQVDELQGENARLKAGNLEIGERMRKAEVVAIAKAEALDRIVEPLKGKYGNFVKTVWARALVRDLELDTRLIAKDAATVLNAICDYLDTQKPPSAPLRVEDRLRGILDGNKIKLAEFHADELVAEIISEFNLTP